MPCSVGCDIAGLRSVLAEDALDQFERRSRAALDFPDETTLPDDQDAIGEAEQLLGLRRYQQDAFPAAAKSPM